MSIAKRALLYLMGAFYVFAGLQHFRVPDNYLPMMPDYLPWHAGLILLSGVAEVLCGLGVLLPRTRRLAAWGTIALLIAVFPANIHVALHNVALFGAKEGAGALNYVRLPLQLLLIAWAWWYTREEPRTGARSEAPLVTRG
ncbi:MAG: DoxX family protein [Myxococcota bacterium]